ncbi:RNA polymerase III transcription factor IIIC subunit-domain-containing protein [Paraphysoderma sedebokerense]|nr:RNA polymerase III transcription factor IIIC subunit-domain-containing protein [Paraphysoderma sedebokerense]
MSELPIISKRITVVTESSSLDYPRAPRHTLPKKEFNCIEYPGYIDNVDKIWETLGGWKRIENCFNETGSLELRYRPTDPFSHPIHGDVVKTANLVVKIRRRRKIRRKPNSDPSAMSVDYDANTPNSHPWEMKAEILGYCIKTCRHRGIADFQWLCDPNDPIVRLRKNMTNLDMEGIKAFKFDTNDTDLDNLRNFPPPMFSRLEWPLNYACRQNPAVVRVAIQNAEGVRALSPIDQPLDLRQSFQYY